ncbi:hypothetical protein [Rhizobium sp. MHM7A]|uniref:hypothetical protein n=1 Tax=Rhizobium sp. MHM7A TaxID=2583233 RepID=UPI00110611CD|nr:hypothetical protein [Rhizobium sp. MHM7A]TLX17207.1 hypothetical protein FFR93_07810 [Rhizobium sp. MHM7A]
MATPKPQTKSARNILQCKLAAVTDLDLSSLLDEIDGDLTKVEGLVDVLNQYRADLFGAGIDNLQIVCRSAPIIKNTIKDHPLIDWELSDRFRPRSYKLTYNLETDTYSAVGAYRENGSSAATIPITAEMLDQLRTRLSQSDLELVEELKSAWAARDIEEEYGPGPGL